MGNKAERHMNRQQEIQQRANLFKPYRSTSSFLYGISLFSEIDGQYKLANDVMKSKRRKK